MLAAISKHALVTLVHFRSLAFSPYVRYRSESLLAHRRNTSGSRDRGITQAYARLVTKARRRLETPQPSQTPRGIFPTVSYQKSRLKKVRIDVAEARKGSSYAKHCILLIPFEAGNGFNKLPLPAPLDSTPHR
jgi:hypothetical protein